MDVVAYCCRVSYCQDASNTHPENRQRQSAAATLGKEQSAEGKLNFYFFSEFLI